LDLFAASPPHFGFGELLVESEHGVDEGG
jgi:hypothetical protein